MILCTPASLFSSLEDIYGRLEHFAQYEDFHLTTPEAGRLQPRTVPANAEVHPVSI